MSDTSDNELLSAYLDDELTPDERRHVEQRLAESAELRRDYEELCALRTHLSALPRHTLANDLPARVLHLAAANHAQPATDDAAAERRGRRLRAIAYPVLAVAAAVAMMLTSPKEKEQPGRQIAQAPPSPAGPVEMSAAPESSAAPAQVTDEMLKLRSESGYLADKAGDIKAEDREAAPAEAAEGNSANFFTLHNQQAGSAGPTGSVAGGSGSAAGTSGPSAVAADSSDMEMEALGRATNRSAGRGRAASPTVLVVSCKLTSRAIRLQAFDAVLARNHVAISNQKRLDQPDGMGDDGKAPAGGRSAKLSEPKAERGNEPAKGARSAAKKDKSWSKRVLVELDSQQLTAVLADLQNHPDQFVAVALPGPLAENEESSLPAVRQQMGAEPQMEAKAAPKDALDVSRPTPPEPALPKSAPSPAAPLAAGKPRDAQAPAADENSEDETAGDEMAADEDSAGAPRDAPAKAEASGRQRLRVLFLLSNADGK
ncbi:MAG TPA: hypothetical protein VMF30_07040 [Pirellulales bacterium]|nr:hypothetical protein [Pirellulales bacterium]